MEGGRPQSVQLTLRLLKREKHGDRRPANVSSALTDAVLCASEEEGEEVGRASDWAG